MCIKEFLGYACGHCSPPNLIICPLTAQDSTFLPCPIPAERSIPALSQYCPGCARALWNKEVLQKENEHRVLHELGRCSYQQCGTAFTEEERKGGKGALIARPNTAIMHAVKQAVDESAKAAPRVSHFHGMVVEYSGDDQSGPIPPYVATRFDNGEWLPSADSMNQLQAPPQNQDFGTQGSPYFQGNHYAQRGNPERALQLYQPDQSGQVVAQQLAREFSSGNEYQNHRGHRHRGSRKPTNHSRGNSSRSNMEFGRYPQQGAHWEQKPIFSGNSQLMSPPSSESKVYQTTTGFYTDPIPFKAPNYAKSSTNQGGAPTVPHSPLSTPERRVSVPQGYFHAYEPEHSSYPIPEILKAASPLKLSRRSQNQQMIEEQRLRVKIAQEEVKERKNAVVELPPDAAISDLGVAVEVAVEVSNVSSPETASYPASPIDTPAQSSTSSPMGTPCPNKQGTSPYDSIVTDDEEPPMQGIYRSYSAPVTRGASEPAVLRSTAEDPH